MVRHVEIPRASARSTRSTPRVPTPCRSHRLRRRLGRQRHLPTASCRHSHRRNRRGGRGPTPPAAPRKDDPSATRGTSRIHRAHGPSPLRAHLHVGPRAACATRRGAEAVSSGRRKGQASRKRDPGFAANQYQCDCAGQWGPWGCRGHFLLVGPTAWARPSWPASSRPSWASAFLRFDMSEYMEKLRRSRLIGASPCYVVFDRAAFSPTRAQEPAQKPSCCSTKSRRPPRRGSNPAPGRTTPR